MARVENSSRLRSVVLSIANKNPKESNVSRDLKRCKIVLGSIQTNTVTSFSSPTFFTSIRGNEVGQIERNLRN
jgi:hypothetical protein